VSDIEYGLVVPFGTDDPEFASGVEWELFRQRLIAGEKYFTTYCMPRNTHRLVTLCEHYNRFCESRKDTYPGWDEIWVGDEIKV